MDETAGIQQVIRTGRWGGLWAALQRGSVQAGLVALVAFFAMGWYQVGPGLVDDGDGGKRLGMQSVGLSGADGYYHIKMAYLYRTGEISRVGENFHWTRESIWNGGFSDKDYLFHLYLSPFTLLADGPDDAGGLIAAAKIANTTLGALLALAMFAALRLLRVKHAWLYVILMMVAGGTYLAFRFNLCRSYLISIALAVSGWALLARNRRLELFLLAVVFTLAYTASHLLLGMLLVRAVMELVLGPRKESTRWRDLVSNGILAGCITGGILLGLLLHPQSANLLHIWWVQNVVVLALSHQETVAPVIDNVTALFGVETNYAGKVSLSLGRELNPTKGPAVVFSTPGVFFAPMVLPLLAAGLRWRPSREAVLTGTIAVVWFILYLLNGRFIEYAAPFSALAMGVWVTGMLDSRGYAAFKRLRPVTARAIPLSLAIIGVIAAVGVWVGAGLAWRERDRGGIEMAGRWLHENKVSHGKVVFHDRWDDFTLLIFYASEVDYLQGLDPTFMLLKDREKYKTWYAIKRGKRREFLETVREDFDASYMLVHRSSSEYLYNRCAEEVKAGRLKLCVRAEDDSWSLFELVEED